MLTLCALLFSMEAAASPKWIDVTANYITNPNFDNGNYDGWYYYRQYYGAGSTNLRVGAMECWNDAFGIRQTLVNLPAGDFSMLCNHLDQKDIETNTTFHLFARLLKLDQSVKPGSYIVEPHMKQLALVRKLRNGQLNADICNQSIVATPCIKVFPDLRLRVNCSVSVESGRDLNHGLINGYSDWV